MVIQLQSCGVLLSRMRSKLRSIFVQLSSGYFSKRFVIVKEVRPYSSTDTVTSWKNPGFIQSEGPDFHVVDYLSTIVHALIMRRLTSISVDEILLPRCVISEVCHFMWRDRHLVKNTWTLFYLHLRRRQCLLLPVTG